LKKRISLKQKKTIFVNKQKQNKMSIRNYIQNAQANYASWTGQPNANNGGYRNYNASTMPTSLVGNRTKLMADGGTGNNAPQSQPYILTVSNSSNTAVSNFDVLGAYTYIGNAGFSNGSLTISNVVISSAIANVNYQQFLYQSMNQPFSVGLTYIESIAGASSQVTQTFTLNTQDSNGNQLLRTIVPTIDPYQQQSTIVAIKQMYSIDGFTKITFASVAGNAAFRIQFYPSTNINLAAGLQGAQVATSYGSPNIVGVPTNIIG